MKNNILFECLFLWFGILSGFATFGEIVDPKPTMGHVFTSLFAAAMCSTALVVCYFLKRIQP
jgi:hypothetical protein